MPPYSKSQRGTKNRGSPRILKRKRMETDKASKQKQNESARQSKKDIGYHQTEAQRNTCDDAEKSRGTEAGGNKKRIKHQNREEVRG